ncbi:helix-turn-helix transcriptional regulator [Erythrobacter alti]|uniref:helix-turn-helix transcriptional regulator n=1 Tax=Erythrobacter alti TaxID=1896145 RepID=UPI0030F44CC0
MKGSQTSVEAVKRTCEAAAFGDTAWTDVLKQVAASMGGIRGILLGGNDAGSYSYSCTFNIDEDVARSYNHHYNRFDPRAAPSMRVPVGETRLGQALVPNSSIAKTEYFDAISRAGDIADSVFGVISNDLEMGRRTISLQRGFSQEFFGRNEAAKLRELLPALDAAMRNSLRVTRALADDRGGSDILYGLLDPSLDLHLLAGGEPGSQYRFGKCEIAGGRLVCGNREIMAAIRHAAERARQGISTTLRHGSASFRFDPVPPAIAWYCAGSDQVFLTIAREVSAGQHDFAIFGESFGLTPKEALVLDSLAQTDTVPQAAQILGISVETARWHVKNICAKTGHPGAQKLVEAARANDLSNLG